MPHKFSNTLVAVDPAGDVVATYRKQHLYDAFGAQESEWVVPGPGRAPDLRGRRDRGLQTCYDLRFPQARACGRRGGARGPRRVGPRRGARTTLLAARAIENTLYVAAADHPPAIGVGASAVIDPMGVTIAGLGETTGVAVAEVSSARVREVRERNPALRLRRYGVTPL
ncbi:nitrilase-related carbon-nitrogen hydrolase [Leifsonia xyli]|uniref:nitrilase-related carbon-nitrogen hydrolase n=1 Tax=Leifsonia xyli TaxID=1575 RepID=UPI000A58D912